MKKIFVAALMVLASNMALAQGEGGWEYGGGPSDGGRPNKDYGCHGSRGGQEGGLPDDGGPNCRPESTPISWEVLQSTPFTIYPTAQIAAAHCRYNENVNAYWDLVNGSWELIGYVCYPSNNSGGGNQ